MIDLKDWNKCLEELESVTTAVGFDLWIKTLVPLEVVNGNLILVTPSSSAKNQILRNHAEHIMLAIKKYMPDLIGFEVILNSEKDDFLNKNDIKEIAKEKLPRSSNPFNPKYTFENFVVGKSNQYVVAAAKGVAENPGNKFNPLFIYGGVGLGKTHILHAIGNYIYKNFPDKKIAYTTSEKFTNDYIESLRGDKDNAIASFREFYRNVDVLMVDDIQFLSNKISTQEEFFHTFNDLYQNNKQIILSSDRSPKEISTLEDRLRSRFASGLIQDIQAPDFETRLAILKSKAQLERYNVESDVLDFIAEKIDTNIREMEGVLAKVVFFANLTGKVVATMPDALEALKETINENTSNLTIDIIADAVCKYYNISKFDLIGKKKNKEFVDPRQVCIYLITEFLNLPLASIGAYFGGRDHTTIMHARDKITEAVKVNPRLKVNVLDIKNILNTKRDRK